MSINILGLLLNLELIRRLIFNKDYFYIFFLCSFFSAISVVFFSGLNITISHINILVLMMYLFIEKIYLKKRFLIGNKILLILFIYLIFSLFINILITNPNLILLSQDAKIVTFEKSNIKDGYKHLILFALSYFGYIYSYNYSFRKKINVNRYFKKILVVIICLNIVQMIFWILNLPYNYFFRNNLSALDQSVYLFGKKIIRLSPTSLEPSMNSIMLIFLIMYFLLKNIDQNKIELTLLFILGFITKSSTFFIGIFFISLFKIIDFIRKRKWIPLFFIFVVIITCIFLFKQNIIEVVEKILGKGYSGSIRLRNLNSNLNLVRNNFFLGIGYGRTRSEDLLTTWLASMGVVGMSLFLSGLGYSIYKANIKLKKYYLIIILVFLVMFISVPEPYYFFIWILWGVLDGKSYRSKIIKNKWRL